MSRRALWYPLLAAVVALPALVGLAVRESMAQALSAAPTIELRFARPSPGPGYDVMRLPRLAPFPPGSDRLYLASAPILSDSQIERATGIVTEDGFVLDLLLTPEGTARFERATRDHRGKLVATVIGSRFAGTAELSVPMTLPTRRIQIGLSVSQAAASELAAELEAKWPR